MVSILDDPRRQVDGVFRLVVECDEPFHEGPRVLAVLSRYVENPDGDYLYGTWWWFPTLNPREHCEPGEIAHEDVLPGGAFITEVENNEVVSISDNFDNTQYLTSSGTIDYARVSTSKGLIAPHERIHLRCPHCWQANVILNVRRVFEDSNQILECPTLDKISAAGMTRVSLRFLAHAVSYGVT